jgi:hypothetical protein
MGEIAADAMAAKFEELIQKITHAGPHGRSYGFEVTAAIRTAYHLGLFEGNKPLQTTITAELSNGGTIVFAVSQLIGAQKGKLYSRDPRQSDLELCRDLADVIRSDAPAAVASNATGIVPTPETYHVVYLLNQGLKNAEVAAQVATSAENIRTIKRRWKQGGYRMPAPTQISKRDTT